MKFRDAADLFVIVIMALVLVAMTYEFNRAAENAEGRIGALELFRESACRDIPSLSDCDIYTQEKEGINK